VQRQIDLKTRRGPQHQAKGRNAMYGKVVLWNEDRGFGFVRQAERLEDIFFHVSEFTGDTTLLAKGTPVEFSLGLWKGKPVARDVRPLESGEAAA